MSAAPEKWRRPSWDDESPGRKPRRQSRTVPPMGGGACSRPDQWHQRRPYQFLEHRTPCSLKLQVVDGALGDAGPPWRPSSITAFAVNPREMNSSSRGPRMMASRRSAPCVPHRDWMEVFWRAEAFGKVDFWPLGPLGPLGAHWTALDALDALDRSRLIALSANGRLLPRVGHWPTFDGAALRRVRVPFAGLTFVIYD